MGSQPQSLRDVLSEKDLLWLAGEQAFQTGREFHAAQKYVFNGANATALQGFVTDISSSYSVEIRLLGNGDIQYACECPAGRVELFCSHCVCCALAWLDETFDATDLWTDARAAISEIDEAHNLRSQLRACLQQVDRYELVEIILDWARRDPAHAHELMDSQRLARFLQHSN